LTNLDGTEISDVSSIQSEDLDFEKPTKSIEDDLMNTQAFGMMYWGFSKLYTNKRVKFHKKAEVFLRDAVNKLRDNSEELTMEHPIDVYDQLL